MKGEHALALSCSLEDVAARLEALRRDREEQMDYARDYGVYNEYERGVIAGQIITVSLVLMILYGEISDDDIPEFWDPEGA